ncbi:MAG TPA: hypothetical protein VJ830_03380, partial [Anaerolineales bacterium]|nr:hypothetical protein [Anaerolineales bacterium]
MNVLLILPIIIPMFTGILVVFFRSSLRTQRLVSLIGAGALLASSIALVIDVYQHGIQAAQMGNWPAPYGITLVADLFGALMVVLAGTVGTAVAVYSLVSIDRQREQFAYHPLYHFLLMG